MKALPLAVPALLIAALAAAPTPVLAAKAAASHAGAQVLPFIEDDYARALQVARQKHLPIFIEAWAPWCHTCRSMKAYVLSDPSLASEAGRFVWLSMDGENAKNVALRKKLAIVGFPTYYVMDPADERVAFRWIGAFNVSQFKHVLDAGELAVQGGKSALDRMLVSADSLAATGQDSLAAEVYGRLLLEAPRGYLHYGRVADALVFSLAQSGQHEAAAQNALEVLRGLGHTPAAANVAATGLSAALELPKENENRAALATFLETRTGELVADTALAISDDDRSGLHITLLDAREAAGDSAGRRRRAERWAAFLEGAAARAGTPERRAVYDSHRLSAYLDLGQPERAVPMLEQSERDLPNDYNPPARLSVALRDLKRWDEALAANDRALAKTYGPRALNIYRTRVDILMGRGDTAGAKAALGQAIAAAEALPEGLRSKSTIESLKKRLQDLH